MNIVSPGGWKDMIVVNGSGLTGNNAKTSANKNQRGHLRLAPIAGDFLRTAHDKPQVFVLVLFKFSEFEA